MLNDENLNNTKLHALHIDIYPIVFYGMQFVNECSK